MRQTTMIATATATAATLALLAGLAVGDEIELGYGTLTGTLVGAKDFQVEFRISSGRKLTKDVAEVKRLQAGASQRSFNEGEKLLADGKSAEAAEKYKRARFETSTDWMKRLIAYRRLLALNRAGDLGGAVELWLELTGEQGASKASRELLPSKPAPKGSAANRTAISLLEKAHASADGRRGEWIKSLLMKLYEAEGLDDKAARLAGASLGGDGDGGEGTSDAPAPVGADVIGSASVLIKRAESGEGLDDARRVDLARQAVKALESAARSSLDKPQLPTALLWMGRGQWVMARHEDDDAVARKAMLSAGLSFMRVVAHFTASQETPEALWRAGRVNEALGNVPAAQKAYSLVAREFADSEPGRRSAEALRSLQAGTEK